MTEVEEVPADNTGDYTIKPQSFTPPSTHPSGPSSSKLRPPQRYYPAPGYPQQGYPPEGQGYPPPQGYPQEGYPPPQQQQEKSRPGMIEGCLAAMCCCCVLEACF
ncbi:hypothetical protein Bca52824_007616 [Brassica carinata]|uniref:Cysteine-rich transmembrane domain-containing protein n=1 Tax=Brassica carinata TaxID=52824 RepID=A0A8X7W6J3_BRACI|nr:hypothetical protein Bca52824_007616 [Brassica carinata]